MSIEGMRWISESACDELDHLMKCRRCGKTIVFRKTEKAGGDWYNGYPTKVLCGIPALFCYDCLDDIEKLLKYWDPTLDIRAEQCDFNVLLAD